MMNVNRGYSGWSMSKNAVQAYADGEMPRSKWTKAAMLSAIDDWCLENDRTLTADIPKMTKGEIFSNYMSLSSWHHTSKFFNETNFYSVNEEALMADSTDSMPTPETNVVPMQPPASSPSVERPQTWQAQTWSAAKKWSDAHRGVREPVAFGPEAFLVDALERYPELFSGPQPSKSGKSSTFRLISDPALRVCVPASTGHGRHAQAFYDGELEADVYGAAAMLLKDAISRHDDSLMSVASMGDLYGGRASRDRQDGERVAGAKEGHAL